MSRSAFENLEVYHLSERIADQVWRMVLGWNNLAGDTVGKQHWLRRGFTRELLTQEQIDMLRPLLDELAPRLNAYLRSIGRHEE